MNLFSFIGGWKITDWEPDQQLEPEGIPFNGVRANDSPLDIAQEPTESSETVRLDWLNDNGDPCSVSGLHFDPIEQALVGKNLLVSFGTIEVACDFSVTLNEAVDPKQLTGVISRSGGQIDDLGGILVFGPDTGSGTFTAQASSGNNTFARRP